MGARSRRRCRGAHSAPVWPDQGTRSLGFEDGDVGLGAAGDDDEVGEGRGLILPRRGATGMGDHAQQWRRVRGSCQSRSRHPPPRFGGPPPPLRGEEPSRPAHQPGPQRVGLGDRRREADRLQPRRQRAQPRQAEREEVAALVGDQRVQLVEDDRIEIGEEAVGVGARRGGAPPARAWSGGCPAGSASGAGACGAACRRCASRG